MPPPDIRLTCDYLTGESQYKSSTTRVTSVKYSKGVLCQSPTSLLFEGTTVFSQWFCYHRNITVECFYTDWPLTSMVFSMVFPKFWYYGQQSFWPKKTLRIAQGQARVHSKSNFIGQEFTRPGEWSEVNTEQCTMCIAHPSISCWNYQTWRRKTISLPILVS